MPNIHGNKMFVDAFEFSDALTVWFKYRHQDKDAGKELMQFLGLHHYQACRDGFMMPVDAVHRLKLLLSPHAQTIIKVWYVRNCKTKEEREFDDNDRKPK